MSTISNNSIPDLAPLQSAQQHETAAKPQEAAPAQSKPGAKPQKASTSGKPAVLTKGDQSEAIMEAKIEALVESEAAGDYVATSSSISGDMAEAVPVLELLPNEANHPQWSQALNATYAEIFAKLPQIQEVAKQGEFVTTGQSTPHEIDKFMLRDFDFAQQVKEIENRFVNATNERDWQLSTEEISALKRLAELYPEQAMRVRQSLGEKLPRELKENLDRLLGEVSAVWMGLPLSLIKADSAQAFMSAVQRVDEFNGGKPLNSVKDEVTTTSDDQTKSVKTLQSKVHGTLPLPSSQVRAVEPKESQLESKFRSVLDYMDIEEAIYYVLSQATQQQDEELKLMLREMEATTQHRKALRDYQFYLQRVKSRFNQLTESEYRTRKAKAGGLVPPEQKLEEFQRLCRFTVGTQIFTPEVDINNPLPKIPTELPDRIEMIAEPAAKPVDLAAITSSSSVGNDQLAIRSDAATLGALGSQWAAQGIDPPDSDVMKSLQTVSVRYGLSDEEVLQTYYSCRASQSDPKQPLPNAAQTLAALFDSNGLKPVPSLFDYSSIDTAAIVALTEKGLTSAQAFSLAEQGYYENWGLDNGRITAVQVQAWETEHAAAFNAAKKNQSPSSDRAAPLLKTVQENRTQLTKLFQSFIAEQNNKKPNAQMNAADLYQAINGNGSGDKAMIFKFFDQQIQLSADIPTNEIKEIVSLTFHYLQAVNGEALKTATSPKNRTFNDFKTYLKCPDNSGAFYNDLATRLDALPPSARLLATKIVGTILNDVKKSTKVVKQGIQRDSGDISTNKTDDATDWHTVVMDNHWMNYYNRPDLDKGAAQEIPKIAIGDGKSSFGFTVVNSTEQRAVWDGRIKDLNALVSKYNDPVPQPKGKLIQGMLQKSVSADNMQRLNSISVKNLNALKNVQRNNLNKEIIRFDNHIKDQKAYDAYNQALKNPSAISQKMSMDGIEEEISKTKNNSDSMSELSQQQSTRLQILTDRKAQLASTLSNIMKKMATTKEGIIANMK